MKTLFPLVTLLTMLTLCLSVSAFADPIREGAEHCVVNTRQDDPLNVRSTPSASAQILSRLPYATCGVMVTGPCQEQWCPIEDGHFAGWVHRHYVAAIPVQSYCVRARDGVALRAWPNRGSRIVTQLPHQLCEIRTLPYRVNEWIKVRAGGWEGWLPSAAIAQRRSRMEP